MTGSSRAWLWPYVRAERAALAVVLLLAIASSALAAIPPWLSKRIIDQGLIAQHLPVLIRLCVLMVGVAAAGFLLGAVNRWAYVRASGRILFSLREAVYAHLMGLAPEFFRQRPVGDLVTRLDGDVAEVQRFSTDTLLAVVNGSLTLVLAGALMVALSPRLALIAAAMLPLQLLVRHRTRHWVADATRAVREQTSEVAHFFVETLGAVRTVQAAAAESWEQARLTGLNANLLRRITRQQLIGYGVGGVSALLSHVGTALVFVAGGVMVIHGSLTVGTLVAFTAYMARGTGSATSLLGLYTAWQRAAVSLTRVRELLEVRGEAQAPPAGAAPPAAGLVEFHDVTCRRAGLARPVFEGLTLTLKPGSKTVLCGDSGSGKSTLVDLLRRFAPLESGSIRLDGLGVGEWPTATLRRRVCVLEAEPVLFRGTIGHNLRYGNFDATEEAVLGAARRAGVDRFVMRLERGYDTRLGGPGYGLSTGQRQRIAIARALLCEPAVLVLDEATSNLDAASAQAMHALIDEHFGHCTRLVITHAPERVPGAARILELREGRLHERAPVKVAHG